MTAREGMTGLGVLPGMDFSSAIAIRLIRGAGGGPPATAERVARSSGPASHQAAWQSPPATRREACLWFVSVPPTRSLTGRPRWTCRSGSAHAHVAHDWGSSVDGVGAPGSLFRPFRVAPPLPLPAFARVPPWCPGAPAPVPVRVAVGGLGASAASAGGGRPG